MRLIAVCCLLIMVVVDAVSYERFRSWNSTKNAADDVIYDGVTATFYCGCVFQSHEDRDGSGDILGHAGYKGPAAYAGRALRVEWEHIVPASLMPAREFDCWINGSRSNCERNDPVAQGMLFDLHNLAPSVGQVNALRGNDRYSALPDSTSDFGSCQIEDSSSLFEPPDCIKGDVARIWFYMEWRHGVEIMQDERAQFARWAAQDPVSPWESEREQRIFSLTGWRNPFVVDVPIDRTGACTWEPFEAAER